MATRDLAQLAKQASIPLSDCSLDTRNRALMAMADALAVHADEIRAANERDLDAARQNGLDTPLLKRLVFDDRKVGAYGTTSATSSIRTVGASTDNGSTFRFSNVSYEVKETPYLYKKGRVYEPSKKTLTKLFPAKKAEIEAALQENHVDFSDYRQVEALLDKLK